MDGFGTGYGCKIFFLLVIPVILGSTVLALGETSRAMFVTIGAGSLVMAFTASFIFSWIGIVWLINFLKRGRLLYFAIYCYVVAFLVFRFIQEIPPTI